VTEYAPAAIQHLFDKVKAGMPEAIMAGILGDQAHDFGYHRGRNYCAPGDYSCELDEDRQGDGEAACALDISWSTAEAHYTASRRLLDAANDSRMYPVRSFYGSTDGVYVCGYDYPGGYPVTSDDSHLWHIHASILRAYANDEAALAGVAEVITGGAGGVVDSIEELPGEVEAMLVQDADSGVGMLVTGGKAIFVRQGADYTAMKTGGVPAATITHTLFNNIAAAMGGARG
jgi:hypothetical protein